MQCSCVACTCRYNCNCRIQPILEKPVPVRFPVLCNQTIVPRTIVTRFDYTCSFLLSSEAAPVAQLQTPCIKPPVILFSGLLTQGAQVSEIKPFLQHTYMWLVYATRPTEMGDPAPFSGQMLRTGSASRWLWYDAGMSTLIHNMEVLLINLEGMSAH